LSEDGNPLYALLLFLRAVPIHLGRLAVCVELVVVDSPATLVVLSGFSAGLDAFRAGCGYVGDFCGTQDNE